MAKVKETHVGMVFGRLTVKELYHTRDHRGVALWMAICDCSCGNLKSIMVQSLGVVSNSCGCYANITHGLTKSKTWEAWRAMWKRTTNPRVKTYSFYKDKVPPIEWKDFKVFLADMGIAPEGLSLERRDNSLGYSKENCYWASYKQQNRNRRSVKLLEVDGEMLTNREIAVKAGVSAAAITYRRKNSLDPLTGKKLPVSYEDLCKEYAKNANTN